MAGSKQKVAAVAPVQNKKSAKKGGKREAEVTVEKVVSAKKPKLVKEEALTAKKKVEAAKKKVVKKEETSSEEVEDESESEEEAPAPVVAPKKKGSAPAVTAKVESSEEECSEDDDDSDEEEAATEVASAEDDDDSDNDDSDDSDEEEDDEMVDAATPASKKATPAQPKTPGNHENAGSKTLFIGNLAFNLEKENVEEFFKEVAETTDVRFVSAPDGTFKGFGYAEFASAADAQKALSLNGGDLLGRPIKLDLARERTGDTPNRDSSKVAAEGTSVFIRGFNKSLDEDSVRSALEEHFGECGEITRVSIPTDRDTGSIKGIAYIDFTKTEEVAKALELTGSDMGGFSLFVDCAKPKPEFGSGGGRGFGSGGGRGGFRGGRGGDRGGRRGRGGDRGGGRRGGGRGRRGGY